MKACGLIVEYNPFHNGHLHHVHKAREVAESDCIIAIMSGPFLQRGEPAIVDKFQRTKMALAAGVDIVLELPYSYAVQSSELFANGAIQTLNNIGVASICFGSESGQINDFINSYKTLKKNESTYTETLKSFLNKGDSFPQASEKAYNKIGLKNNHIDLSKPNNILGFSYVKTIYDNNLPISPLTIKRIDNHFHESVITGSIASATSIRKQVLAKNSLTLKAATSIPDETAHLLMDYKKKATLWHTLDHYFPFIHYRVLTMHPDELAALHGVDEGLEHRIIKTAKEATSMRTWIKAIKTKRYTWTRIQRIFIHILMNITKQELTLINKHKSPEYIRMLGFTNIGRKYLNKYRKDIPVPIISQLGREQNPILTIDERASHVYYSILPIKNRLSLWHQELQPPIMVN